MPTHRWADIKNKGKNMTPERAAKIARQVEEDLLEMSLRTLREATGTTQEELAERIEVSQSQLSKFEMRDDHLISTLRRYVVALGGQLEISAIINGKRISLVDV